MQHEKDHKKMEEAMLSMTNVQPPGPRRKAFWIGIGIIAVVAVAAITWVSWGMGAKEREFENNLGKRLELIAISHVQLAEALIETAIEQANRVISADLFRLYAAEIDLVEGDVSRLVGGVSGLEGADEGLAQLSAQLPMMQNLLIDFTHISGYLEGRVVNRNGTVYISTDASTTPLRDDQKALAERVLALKQPQFGPLKYAESGLILEAFLPIFPPEASGLEQSPVAVLLLTKAVGKRFDEIRSSSLMTQGERSRWVQKTPEGFQEVVPWLPGQLQKIDDPFNGGNKDHLPFALRVALTGEDNVYSVGQPVSGPDWWIVVEADPDLAAGDLRDRQRAMISIAVLLILIFGVGFGAVWAVFISQQDRKVAKHFEQLAGEIEKQRQLLDRINNTISDYIVLKDLDGHYRYVNPAFAEAVGRSAEELIGLDNEAVFGYDTAKRLQHSDQQVMTSEETVTLSETVFLQSQPHHLQICKPPLKDPQGKLTGIVAVIRDVTEIVEVQKRQEQATRKTVEALVRAIELTDPYLAGHSRLMGTLSVEVAKAMNAGDIDIATVETAANLSQVGKLFVDRDLLFKTDPLNDEEKREMEQHVDHAANVLKDIDFGLPVFEAVWQMNECYDGSGYPEGLKGAAIGLPARILALANSFCAMVEPRAYRSARSIDETIAILGETSQAYDPKAMEALKEVVTSSVGEKLLAKYKTEN